MKVYVSVALKGTEDKERTEELCAAVRAAGLSDYCFARDALKYKDRIRDPKELWSKISDEIGACDALLIDVSGHPTSGRLVEMGIAYALHKSVIVVERKGTHHKELFYGVSSEIIKYNDYEDLTKQLKRFDDDRSFGMTDKWTVFSIFLVAGGALTWFASQFFLPLAFVVMIAFWLVVRQLFPLLRAFDRVVIYIPLAVIWLAVFYLLQPVYMPLSLAWLVGFWLVMIPVLQKLKFSL